MRGGWRWRAVSRLGFAVLTARDCTGLAGAMVCRLDEHAGEWSNLYLKAPGALRNTVLAKLLPLRTRAIGRSRALRPAVR